jgi:hypothetical protein
MTVVEAVLFLTPARTPHYSSARSVTDMGYMLEIRWRIQSVTINAVISYNNHNLKVIGHVFTSRSW